MSNELIQKCFMLSSGHLDTLKRYGDKWDCGTDTESLRFLLNECKRNMTEE